MQALLFSWLTYLVGAYFIERDFKRLLFLSGAFVSLVLYYLLGFLGEASLYREILIVVYFMFIFLHFSSRPKLFLLVLFWLSGGGYLLSAVYFPQYSPYFVSASGLVLLLRDYYSRMDLLIWSAITLTVSVSYLVDRELFFYANLLFVFYFLRESVSGLLGQIEKEKKRYRDFVDRAITSEIQKKYSEIDDELKITYKKLKVIFKLSNITLSPLEIEEIAERVVEGLHNLGYSGVILYVNTENFNAFKKSGFFPYMKNYLENRFENIEKITISEDEKQIFLPLKSDKGKIGVLAVYKKEGISPKEIEYLSTYANSVAISITKTIYFKEINKLQDLLEKTFETVDIGIAIVNREYRIERANRALKEITGRELDGTIFEAIPEIEPLKRELESVIKDNRVVDTVLSSISRKGSIYRIKALPLVSGEGEERDKMVLVIEDITEKEKLEAQLIETEKHAVIGKMVAGLSHDIKNPLAAISASAFAIKRRGNRLKDGKIIELAEKIEKNSSRAADIISKLLNFAKPSYYKMERVNLKDVLLSSIEFALPEKKKNVKIYRRLRSDVYTYGDRNALQQVFINLLINAIEAIEDRQGIIEVKLTKDKEHAVISIKDNGVGIPKDVLNEVFDPFFTTKEKGTGLGLSVVKKIITDHGGEIEVNSVEGGGTEFIIRLPLSFREE
ncbi:MAG: GHKL domain-containing protein [Aquificae bacterium]|nr:GHKL domain-containing protein [Aquificota bacterium]